MASLFTRIVAGEIPCHKVFEDSHVLAFLDIGPLSPGHALLVPKEECVHLHELSPDAAQALGAALPKVCRAVMQATGATAYNVLQNNGALAHQEVPHVHIHIIPKYSDGRGLGLTWNASKVEHTEAAALAARIRAAIQA
jgi:histidine triad (HIT) family protein